MKRLVMVLLIVMIVTGASCAPQTLTNSLSGINEKDLKWEYSFGLDSLTCKINALIEYNSIPIKIYSVQYDAFNLEDIKVYLQYFDIPIDNINSIPIEGNYTTKAGDNAYIMLSENYISVQLGTLGIVQLEDWVVVGNAYPGEPSGTLLLNIKIKQDEAEKIAEQVVTTLNINNVTLSEATKARIIAPDNHTITEGWYLSYVFNVGSIPFDIAYASPYGDMLFQPGKYTAPWSPQRLDLFIDHEGVKYFRFCDRLKTISMDDTELMPLDEIKSKIIGYFKEGYQNTHLSEEDAPTIIRITLSHSLIKGQKDGEGILVPAWIVYFTTPYYKKNYLLPAALCINAIDGSRIDPFYG